MLKGPLLRLIARRVLLGLLTLSLVSVVVFAATEVLPGDAARAILGRSATPERIQALRSQLHLDQPLVAQYTLWLGGLLSGDPGKSLVNGQPVWQLVLPRVINSLTLLSLASLPGVPFAIVLGIVAAVWRGRMLDSAVSVLALALAALPEFVVAIALILILATTVFHWLPPVSLVPPGAAVLDRPLILVLPVLTLVLVMFPYIFRMMRSSMIDVLNSEYIEMGRLKGLSQRRLVFVHALPNAVAPTIQVVALTLAYLAGGVVLVEYVFGFPGIGQALISAILARDMPTIQCIVLLLAGFYVAVNIAADVLAVMVTPKLRARAWQRA